MIEYIVWVVALITAFANVKFIYQTIKNKEYRWTCIFIATMLNLLFSVYVVLKNQ